MKKHTYNQTAGRAGKSVAGKALAGLAAAAMFMQMAAAPVMAAETQTKNSASDDKNFDVIVTADVDKDEDPGKFIVNLRKTISLIPNVSNLTVSPSSEERTTLADGKDITYTVDAADLEYDDLAEEYSFATFEETYNGVYAFSLDYEKNVKDHGSSEAGTTTTGLASEPFNLQVALNLPESFNTSLKGYSLLGLKNGTVREMQVTYKNDQLVFSPGSYQKFALFYTATDKGQVYVDVEDQTGLIPGSDNVKITPDEEDQKKLSSGYNIRYKMEIIPLDYAELRMTASGLAEYESKYPNHKAIEVKFTKIIVNKATGKEKEITGDDAFPDNVKINLVPPEGFDTKKFALVGTKSGFVEGVTAKYVLGTLEFNLNKKYPNYVLYYDNTGVLRVSLQEKNDLVPDDSCVSAAPTAAEQMLLDQGYNIEYTVFVQNADYKEYSKTCTGLAKYEKEYANHTAFKVIYTKKVTNRETGEVKVYTGAEAIPGDLTLRIRKPDSVVKGNYQLLAVKATYTDPFEINSDLSESRIVFKPASYTDFALFYKNEADTDKDNGTTADTTKAAGTAGSTGNKATGINSTATPNVNPVSFSGTPAVAGETRSPSTTASTTGSGLDYVNGVSRKTGDSSNVPAYVAMGAGAVIIAAAAVIVLKKKKQK